MLAYIISDISLAPLLTELYKTQQSMRTND